MISVIGYIVLVGGIGHVITGLIIFRPQLVAISNDERVLVQEHYGNEIRWVRAPRLSTDSAICCGAKYISKPSPLATAYGRPDFLMTSSTKDRYVKPFAEPLRQLRSNAG